MNAADEGTFKDEANDLLWSLEEFLLELERVPDDLELMGKVLRDLRSTRQTGDDELPVVIERVRTIYDRVRNGEIRVIRKLIDFTLEARDSLRAIIDGKDSQGPTLKATLLGLKELVREEAERSPSANEPRSLPHHAQGGPSGFPP
jgi:two-component system chemotaxis sensor kinase CheA